MKGISYDGNGRKIMMLDRQTDRLYEQLSDIAKARRDRITKLKILNHKYCMCADNFSSDIILSFTQKIMTT